MDESLSEQLIQADEDEDDVSVTGSMTSDLSSITNPSLTSLNGGSLNGGNYR